MVLPLIQYGKAFSLMMLQASHSSMAIGSIPDASNEQSSCAADALKSESDSGIGYDLWSLDYNSALQELLAMSKAKVRSNINSTHT